MESLWVRGVFWGDGASLRAALGDTPEPATHSFTLLATLVSSEPPALLPPAPPATAPEDVALAAVGAVWAAVVERRPVTAAMGALAAALDQLSWTNQLLHLERRQAVEAWADVALGHAAQAIGDLDLSRRRWLQVATREDAPPGARAAARVGLGAQRDSAARIHLELARELAETAGATAAAGHHAFQLALLALVQEGDRRAIDRVEGGNLEERVEARLLSASLDDTLTQIARLAGEIRRAGEEGDVVTYLACVVAGARVYERLDRVADAVATLSFAAGNLDQAGLPRLGGVLREERHRLRLRVGETRFDAAVAAVWDELGPTGSARG